MAALAAIVDDVVLYSVTFEICVFVVCVGCLCVGLVLCVCLVVVGSRDCFCFSGCVVAGAVGVDGVEVVAVVADVLLFMLLRP